MTEPADQDPRFSDGPQPSEWPGEPAASPDQARSDDAAPRPTREREPADDFPSGQGFDGYDLTTDHSNSLPSSPVRSKMSLRWLRRTVDRAEGERLASRSEPRSRRVRLPLTLFVVTCLSTFWVGANHWLPIPADGDFRRSLLVHWQEGLIYMGCVLAILIAHEMGHFLTTVRYGVPASFPYFIPFPISPIGTMGAVIGMDGLKANRKELFDIGLAGPLAGLFLAVPIMWIGVMKLDFTEMGYGPFALDLPLLSRLALLQVRPPGYEGDSLVWFSQLNPYFMAGWVGLLITGLNMMPVSQLDGGHVVYTLLGRMAHWIARAFIVSAVLLVIVSGQWQWSLMILLVLFIGPDHPPTRDDSVPLGAFRTVIGFAAILIPIFCFPIHLIYVPV